MTNEKIKKYFLAIIAISSFILAISIWSYSQTYSQSIKPSSFRSFSVSSEGRSVVIPDIAQFSFSVITEGGKDISVLQKENTKKTNDAMTFLKSENIDKKDIKTTNYSLNPRYQYSSCPRNGGVCPPAKIIGYKITQTVVVKIRDFSKIGEVLSGIIRSGANRVSELSFTLDNPDKAQNIARREAIEKAKEKAKLIADAGGFSLGRLLSITESGGLQPVRYSAFKEAGGIQSASPIIEPGSRDVRVNVTLKYEIK